MKRPETILYHDLKSLGFQRKGRQTLFIRQNDVIGLLSFDRPTSHLYVTFAILPLFLPCQGFIHYSYGNRLDSMYPRLPFLNKESTEEEIDEFCFEALWHIQGDLLPFLESMSTAKALMDFSKKGVKPFGRRFTKYIFCMPCQLGELYLYSSLYLKDYKEAIRAAAKYEKMILKAPIQQKLKDAEIQQCKSILAAIREENYSWIDSMLEKNIESNLALFM